MPTNNNGQLPGQISLMDESQEYRDFVEKFKPKKTTDDCYTPELVYQAVLDYCVRHYGVNPEKVIRPFWPGGDYEREAYPDGCVVVDNPPFSMITRIARWYQARGIPFFLFAPYLTLFSIRVHGVTYIVCGATVTY